MQSGSAFVERQRAILPVPLQPYCSVQPHAWRCTVVPVFHS